MADTYHADSALEAEAEAALRALAKELDRTHLAAAASLREGRDGTLTVLRLGVPPTLARTLRSTNATVMYRSHEGQLELFSTHRSRPLRELKRCHLART